MCLCSMKLFKCVAPNTIQTQQHDGYPNSSFIEPDVIQITIVKTNTI